jgi:hypothetical protein
MDIYPELDTFIHTLDRDTYNLFKRIHDKSINNSIILYYLAKGFSLLPSTTSLKISDNNEFYKFYKRCETQFNLTSKEIKNDDNFYIYMIELLLRVYKSINPYLEKIKIYLFVNKKNINFNTNVMDYFDLKKFYLHKNDKIKLDNEINKSKYKNKFNQIQKKKLNLNFLNFSNDDNYNYNFDLDLDLSQETYKYNKDDELDFDLSDYNDIA